MTVVDLQDDPRWQRLKIEVANWEPRPMSPSRSDHEELPKVPILRHGPRWWF